MSAESFGMSDHTGGHVSDGCKFFSKRSRLRMMSVMSCLVLDERETEGCLRNLRLPRRLASRLLPLSAVVMSSAFTKSNHRSC